MKLLGVTCVFQIQRPEKIYLVRVSTRLIKGDLSTFARVAHPLFLFLFCEALTTLGMSVFLSHHSIDAVSSSLNATYLSSMFNNPCMAIASMAQIFVGLYQGSSELKRIGPCVWQLIWFSLMSLVITLPLSFCSSNLYFKETSIEHLGMEYFNILALGNFLFPLSTAFSSFYLGRGKTMLVTSLTMASYAIDLGLCWILVFGIEGFIPSLGVKGAALAKCGSLALLCLTFFCLFLAKKNRALYGTNLWRFSPAMLWFYIRPGIVRAFGYFWIRVGWVMISYIMIKKGGSYLDVITIGGTVINFLVFAAIGIYRAILTIAPILLGAGENNEIKKLCRSLMIYIAMIGIVLAVPLLLYPQSLIYVFNASSRDLFSKTFQTINYGIWFYMVTITFQMGWCGLIVASRDLKIQFYAYLLSYLTSLLPVYFAMQLGGASADKLWFIMGMDNMIFGLFYFFRFRQGKWEKRLPLEPNQKMIQNEPI